MLTLLHVEDEDTIAVIFRAALDAAKIQVTVYRVSDGEQALNFLRRSGPYVGVRQPDLIFLDLNTPRMDGWQVLAEMHADKSLPSIPVIVLSSSSRQCDKDRAFALGAQEYINKPLFFNDWITEVQSAYRKFAPAT
jgi:CheY-like chemotaxis protein